MRAKEPLPELSASRRHRFFTVLGMALVRGMSRDSQADTRDPRSEVASCAAEGASD